MVDVLYALCGDVSDGLALVILRLINGPPTPQKIHITNEIIHNPGVNERLADMKIDFVPGAWASPSSLLSLPRTDRRPTIRCVADPPSRPPPPQ